MLTKKLELCRTGVHGQAGTAVTDQDLKEITETYSPKSAAVTIWPHELAKWAPALGTVDSVWTAPSVKDPSVMSLYGSVTFNDLLADAYENKKLYPTWSIGAPRRAEDGKRYLHHLKMCGAEPGAVKGLHDLGIPSGINLADCPASDVFSLDDPQEDSPTQTNDKKEDQKMDPLQVLIDAIEDPDEKAKAQLAYDKLKKDAAKGAAAPNAPAKPVPEINASDAEALRAENGRLKDTLRAVAEKYPDAGITLSDAPEDPRVAALYAGLRRTKRESLLKAAEGRVPKAMQGDLIALADALPVTDTIALEDDEKHSPIDVLTRLFQNLPEPVAGELIGLSDPAGKGKKSIAASATFSKF